MDYNTLIIRGAEIMGGGFSHFRKVWSVVLH